MLVPPKKLLKNLNVRIFVYYSLLLDMSFTDAALRQIWNPANRGFLEGGQYGVCGVPGEGAYVEIWVEINNEKVQRASYEAPGCPSSVACAGLLCKLIQGRGVEAVKLLTPEDLKAVVGTLPEGKEPYLRMSIEALHQAIGWRQ